MTNEPTPTFGHLMCLLAERSIDTWCDDRGVMRSKLTCEERSIQCTFWADEYPGMAEDLRAVARQYGAALPREETPHPVQTSAPAQPEVPYVPVPATPFPEEVPYVPDLSVLADPPDQAPVAMPEAEHTCHALGCTIPIAPRMFMCRTHWFLLDKRLRDAIWRHYRVGQEVDKRPSDEYIKAAKAAIAAVALKEQKSHDGTL